MQDTDVGKMGSLPVCRPHQPVWPFKQTLDSLSVRERGQSWDPNESLSQLFLGF